MSLLPRLAAGALAALASVALSAAGAAPMFVNGLAIPGTTTDLSGDPPINNRFGFFSDLYYDPIRKEWWGLPDRGPGGGTLSYDTRVERFTLDVNPTTGAISNFQIAQTIKFTDPTMIQIPVAPLTFNGLAPNPTNALGRAFDPEGFVVNPLTGRFLVSDEYGPSLYEFNRDGTLFRTFTTPANVIPRSNADVPNFAGDLGNTKGKRSNRGFEGLAVSPDGRYAYAMLQSAMLDEGGPNGEYARIVKFDTATGTAVAQFAYKLDGSSQGRGISALVALNDEEFLVLERNNRGVGVDSNLADPNKKVFKINIAGADDVTNVTLPATGALPMGKVAVSKTATPFIDMTANTLAALGNRVPEKWEGLTIGPRLGDGTYSIVLGTDADYSVTQIAGSSTQFDILYNPATGERIRCDLGTRANCIIVPTTGGEGMGSFMGLTDGFELIPGVLHAYKSAAGDLASYVGPITAPAPLALFGLGLVGLAALRRRRR